MTDLPSGTVAFLFTDIEGSTRLWEHDRVTMHGAVERHLAILRRAVAAHGGVLFKVVGDATQSAFAVAPEAAAAAVEAQQALLAEPWSDAPGRLEVRMALHAGEATPHDGDYLAAPLNRLSRLLSAGHGGQVVLTAVVERLVAGNLLAGVSLRPLGTHRLRDLQDPEAVFQVVAPGLPEQFPALRSMPSHPTNLTTPPTALIGREAEVATVLRLLDEGARLVTLTGPGGTGKTRLAQEIAAEALDRFPDGVFFVDLSALSDATLVVPTIAAALGVRESAGSRLLDTLSRFLLSSRMLLVLDNFEQVLDSAPDASSLLAAGPSLTILATSREALHVRGEREMPLRPLPLPATDHRLPLPELAHVPAVSLFVERAAASQPDFALTAENAQAVAAICRRLDGLPLAIELAAARVKVLPPAALLTRLEKRLPMLTGGGRDLPTRQRTMGDAIAWSYDLLTPAEQRLFRRLAVFAGGFTLSAAEEVAGVDDALNVFDGVSALIEQSLLRQRPAFAGEPRYRMLEIVREYGLERLATCGDVDEVRARHAAYTLRHAAGLARGYNILANMDSVARVAFERDNLRLALAWFEQRGESEALLQLSTVLLGLWLAQGLHGEGLQWLVRALERSSQVASVARVEALDAATVLAIFQGNYAQAADLVVENLALARALGDPLLIAQALTTAGLLSYRKGEYGHAGALVTEALVLLRGDAEMSPDAAQVIGRALLILGDTALAQEQFAQAALHYEETLETLQMAGNDWRSSDVRAGLAGARYYAHDLAGAAALYLESLARARELESPLLVVSSLLGLGSIAAEAGQAEVGARLFGVAEAISASQGAPIFPRDEPIRDRGLAELQAALGEEQLAAAREAGGNMTAEQADALASQAAAAVTASK